MSDAFWYHLFASIPPTVAAIGALIVSLYNARAAKRAAKTAENVHTKLVQREAEQDERFSEITEAAHETTAAARETYHLANSSMLKQMQITAMALRRVAQLTEAPADVKAAADAEAVYAEHADKQALAYKRRT